MNVLSPKDLAFYVVPNIQIVWILISIEGEIFWNCKNGLKYTNIKSDNNLSLDFKMMYQNYSTKYSKISYVQFL